jgi:hypothetical protein
VAAHPVNSASLVLALLFSSHNPSDISTQEETCTRITTLWPLPNTSASLSETTQEQRSSEARESPVTTSERPGEQEAPYQARDGPIFGFLQKVVAEKRTFGTL